MIISDVDAYRKYPKLRHWFNKLWLAESFDYLCGPAGIAPSKSGYYIVRPIMNLMGMSAGAEKKWISAGDDQQVPLGFFWCEWFTGTQITVDYEWLGYWSPLGGWKATVDETNLSQFKKWERIYDFPSLDSFYDELADSNIHRINVEFVDSNPIEVHLRTSFDPDYDVLIPIWKDEIDLIDKYKSMGYSYIEDFDDANGFLKNPRCGFIVSTFNKKEN